MKIRVDVPTDELHRERVERATFERLDAIRSALEVPAGDPQRSEQAVFDQLAVIRSLDRSDDVLRPRRRWVPAIAIAAPLAAVGAIAFLLTRTPPPSEQPVAEPVVSQHAGPSQWASGEAVVQAFADTAVEERIDDGGVTLTLARGKVDCEVEPRIGRAPFRVLAGDITVTVIGTQFSVARVATGVRVEVARGKVSVRRGGDEKFLLAGDSWSSEPVITAQAPAIEPAPEPAPEIEVAPELARRPTPTPTPTPKEAYAQAQKVEPTNPTEAARLYRIAAAGRDSYAGLALYALVDLERRRGNDRAALAAADRYLAAFPRGTAVEELMWLRVDIYRKQKPAAPMRAAAEAYLERFPSGTYATQARDVLAR